MECVLESSILYLQNKLLKLGIRPFSEPWVQSENRGEIVKFGLSGTRTKKCYKMVIFHSK
jgi:hypothetical protein